MDQNFIVKIEDKHERERLNEFIATQGSRATAIHMLADATTTCTESTLTGIFNQTPGKSNAENAFVWMMNNYDTVCGILNAIRVLADELSADFMNCFSEKA